MHIAERSPGDLARLWKAARRERDAEQRDRLLAVAKVIDGRETLAIEDLP